MATRLVVRSHWNAMANKLDGTEYESLDEALTALRRYIGDDLVPVRFDDGSVGIYRDEESADRDTDGGRTCAVVERLSSDLVEARS